jgi:hypothetical protein
MSGFVVANALNKAPAPNRRPRFSLGSLAPHDQSMKTFAISITLGFLLSARLVTAQTNLIFNDTFDTSIAGWSTSIGASWYFLGDPSGGPGGCLALSSIIPMGGGTSQAFNGLVPGSNYLCSWSGMIQGPGLVTLVGGYVDNAGMTYSGTNPSWEYFGFVFTAQSVIGSHVIGFNTPGPNGYLFDNVSIRSIPETPRPTLQMFSTQNWVALSVSGPSGQSVVLEASTNLVSWHLLRQMRCRSFTRISLKVP